MIRFNRSAGSFALNSPRLALVLALAGSVLCLNAGALAQNGRLRDRIAERMGQKQDQKQEQDAKGDIKIAEAMVAEGVSAEQRKLFDASADYSAKLAGRAVLVQHKGQTLYQRYDNNWKAEMPHPLASGTKSFTGVAAMIAVQEGLLTLGERACLTISEWKDDPVKSQITVRNLLELSSGLQPDSNPGARKGSARLGDGGKPGFAGAIDRTGRDDWFGQAVAAPMTGKPGEQFAYGGNHFYAFGELLQRKLKAKGYKGTVWDWYSEKIFNPIGMKVGFVGKDKKGNANLPGGCGLSAREWVKFGQLMLNQGSWTNEKGEKVTVIKPELLAECFKSSANNPSYGLTWWLLRSGDTTSSVADGIGREGISEALKRRNFDQQSKPLTTPDGKTIEVYMAAGLGKQRLYVLPQFDLVVVRFAENTSAGARFDNRAFVEPILKAVAPEVFVEKKTGEGEKKR